ncbi:virulence protein RhuM/Fic/DOC family protein [Galbibacter sp. EGI 63066]|uniref:virulence protein RhuM/Fic/DOC family protein n=1 Tax=Galbibacter sp. EGI 63066 TaxID=2993559 RepID=UPI0022487847|nr:virulence protein RhuM/Fic/DOC family protein [Galbibacter sp. EGI 63066]MCX2680697.1 virulence protein RhuM/Fic/DOC family protein [Galbibacter sp. EGI 63066]
MNLSEIKNSEVVVFKPESGQTEFQVLLDSEHDTVWATEQQIMDLFGKARRTIEYHIKNIYEEGELDKKSTWRKFRQVQKEGKREVSRKVPIYNLDVIISVGYRVKSKVGIEFRKWATQKLKEYLLKGYSINQELLKKEKNKVSVLQEELNTLSEELLETQKTLTSGLLSIISHYSKSFELLDKYDKDELSSENLNKDVIYVINYEDVKKAIQKLKSDLIEKGEAGDLFGNEKDDSFKGILGSVSQTVFGELAYPTIEEQAVQLLYSIIKGHPFSDGNKRIGSFIFVWFLELNKYHRNEKGERKINDNTLVTLALAVAQSLPEQRETIQKLIMNLIKN